MEYEEYIVEEQLYKEEISYAKNALEREKTEDDYVEEVVKHLYCAIQLYVLAVVRKLGEKNLLSLSERIESELSFSGAEDTMKKANRRMIKWMKKLCLFDRVDRKYIKGFIKNNPCYNKKCEIINVDNINDYVLKIENILKDSKLMLAKTEGVEFELSINGINEFLKTYKEIIALITTLITAIGASNEVSHWYNFGFLDYWGLTTDIIEPARNIGVLHSILIAIFIALAFIVYVAFFALLWRRLDQIKKFRKRILFITLFEIAGPILGWTAITIYVFKLFGYMQNVLMLVALVYASAIVFIVCFRNGFFTKEVQQFYLTKKDVSDSKVGVVVLLILLAIIIAVVGLAVPTVAIRNGYEAAERMSTVQIITYENEEYMVIAANDSKAAVERVTEYPEYKNNKKKWILTVYTEEQLLLDADQIGKIELKKFDEIICNPEADSLLPDFITKNNVWGQTAS